MPSYDTAGRISRQSFIISSSTLFVVSLLSILGRLYIRLRIQKQFSMDDGFLILGTCCMACSLGLTLTFMDTMYMVETVTLGEKIPFALPPDFSDRVHYYRKVYIACLILTWFTIVSVKFSFLALFRRLTDRIQPLILCWRIAAVFNGAVSIYGVTVPFLACPYLRGSKSAQCVHNRGLRTGFNYALSQMILDIVGDLLILIIPVRLIWQIRARWTQKLALACSLCLISVMTIFTVIRASGLERHEKLDEVWVTFWQILAAETGLALAAMSAFRALYVSRAKERRVLQTGNDIFGSHRKDLLRRLRTRPAWYARSTTRTCEELDQAKANNLLGLPSIPGGTLTGVSTFINSRGRATTRDSRKMQSVDSSGDNGDGWPLSDIINPVQA